MHDRETPKAAPTDTKAPLTKEEERVRKKKADALRRGDLSAWPTKGEQNGWSK